MEYKDEFVEKAIDVARNLKADLGGTDIFNPLQKIFSEEVLHGQRQIFIMTDGEVMNVEKILRLISMNSNNNRCFTIGIGRGCDAGLVEGMANSSGGKSDFVQEGDSISEKVIPQLQSSLHPSLHFIEIHVENNESFEVSPFPIPAINPKGSSVVYLSSKNSLNEAVLINGVYGDESIEIPINEIDKLEVYEEDKFGCSGGKNIGNAIFPLFAFNIIRLLDSNNEITPENKMKIINLSISSGVLSKQTAFVGISQRPPIKSGRTRQTARRCTGGCTPRKSFGFKAARKSTNVIENEENANFVVEKVVEYNLMSIARLQKITGYWDDLNTVNKILGLNVDQIDGINIENDQLRMNCIATVLAIASLHVKLANEKNSWLMIEQKALDWLRKNLHDVDVMEIIRKVEKLIK